MVAGRIGQGRVLVNLKAMDLWERLGHVVRHPPIRSAASVDTAHHQRPATGAAPSSLTHGGKIFQNTALANATSDQVLLMQAAPKCRGVEDLSRIADWVMQAAVGGSRPN